jgi:iron complex outermembrane receptor protein
VNQPVPFRRRFAGAVALSLSAVLLAAPALAQPGDATPFSLPAAPLGDALRAFSVQTGVPVIFTEALVSGRSSRAVKDSANAEAALGALLDGTGLEAVAGAGGYVIRQKTVKPERGPENSGGPVPVPEPVPGRPNTRVEAEEETDLRIDRVMVTGTSLRGIAPESSPLQVFTRDDILGSGVTTTEQFLRTLPQNFGGGSTEFTVRGLPDDGNSQRNNTYATGANLRGLGAGATLTLVNGGRLAPTSTIGDFIDLSMIPATAIDRIEVLTDGASSIYGGDAVAGVVNLILREDFRGSETSLRYGSVTEGDHAETRFSQTFGGAWAGGNLMATYEYFDRGSLRLSDRPDIAAPRLLNGGQITVADSINLLPEQARKSFVLSGGQRLSDRLKLSATALYSDRKVSNSTVGIANTTTVADNEIESESLAGNLLANYAISDRWGLSLEGGYSEIRSDQFQQIVQPARGTPVRVLTESALWSVGLVANGDLFELPAGTIQAAVGGQFRNETLRSVQVGAPVLRDGERDIAALFGEVQIPVVSERNALPGIRRLELNLSGRHDDYSDFGATTNPKAGILWAPVDNLKIRSSYSTSFAPPKLGQSGALDRGVGVLRYDFIRGVLNIPLPDPSLAGVNYLITAGTAAGLGPETSRTFTAGFDLDHVSGRHDLRFSGNYYDIRFEDRLGVTPVPGNLNANFAPGFAFADPSLFPEGTVIFFPGPDEIAAVLASLTRPVTFAGGATAIENIGFINNVSLTRNLASTETRGLDFQAAYEMDADVGRLTARLNASYILEFSRRASDTTPIVETLNTQFNPVDLHLRGQLGLSRGAFTGTVFANYVDSYATDSTQAARPIRSWTTFDLALSYRFGEDEGWLADTVIGLSAQNLFDQAPPATPPQTGSAITGYDPANASPLGRFVAVDIRKSF